MPPVVVDEVQYATAFFRHIKAHVDANKGRNGLFVITGSQNILLMGSIAESLAGAITKLSQKLERLGNSSFMASKP